MRCFLLLTSFPFLVTIYSLPFTYTTDIMINAWTKNVSLFVYKQTWCMRASEWVCEWVKAKAKNQIYLIYSDFFHILNGNDDFFFMHAFLYMWMAKGHNFCFDMLATCGDDGIPSIIHMDWKIIIFCPFIVPLTMMMIILLLLQQYHAEVCGFCVTSWYNSAALCKERKKLIRSVIYK